MTTEVVVFTIVYGLIVVCAVFPPREFVSSGLTIKHIFARFLGSEDLQFIHYHIRRTTLTLIIHSLLPLGYCIGVWRLNPVFNVSQLSTSWELHLCTLVSFLVFIGMLMLTFSWHRNGWKKHPLARILAIYANGRSWSSVASDVNVEFRRFDKFASSSSTLSRVIVTDSWIMLCASYHVDIVHQSDIHLSMLSSDEHQLSHLGNVGSVQMLNIRVDNVRKDIPPFKIRLNSLEYNDFKERLKAPIRNAQSIVIHQTLSDRFVDAFKTQVMENQRHCDNAENIELEACIGCMQSTANIKLQKLCNNPDVGDCLNCYCRPMWCVECMGKWFASRQDQSQPDSWLASKSPCPTCRATFCMLDVCLIE